MRLLNKFPSVLSEAFVQDCSLKKSQAIPGLSLSMERIVAKTASGGVSLTPEQRAKLYDAPDKTFADWSPDINEMTLAERAQVRKRLSAELEGLKRKMKDDDDRRKADDLRKQELELRQKILAEMDEKSRNFEEK